MPPPKRTEGRHAKLQRALGESQGLAIDLSGVSAQLAAAANQIAAAEDRACVAEARLDRVLPEPAESETDTSPTEPGAKRMRR